MKTGKAGRVTFLFETNFTLTLMNPNMANETRAILFE